jgi:glucokinase
MQKYIASADIGATKIAVCIASKSRILIKVLQKTKKQGSIYAIHNQIENLIDFCCKKISIKKSDLKRFGIVACGVFKKQGKYSEVFANNISGIGNSWGYIPLEKQFSKKYILKIGNDAATSAKAEKLFGKAKNIKNFVYLTWSTGIGTGAYVDNNLLQGKNNNAPHGGHIYMAENGPKCSCGQKADMESLASGSALEKIYGKKPIELFKDCKKGNKKAINLVKKVSKTLAKGLVSINAVLDTEMFVLGGSIMKHKSILLPLIQKEFYSNSFKPLTKDVKITTSDLGEYIADLAAFSLVLPKDWINRWQKTKPWKKIGTCIILD